MVECLRSGWMTSGPRAQQFEQAFARRSRRPGGGGDFRHRRPSPQCTRKVRPGNEVITSPMTFASTVNIIAILGAKAVFVDIDYDHLMLRPELLEKAITKKTRAIVPVDIAGAACDLDPIMATAKQHGIPVIEDAAHALGTRYHGRPIGSFPQTAIFSFQAIKNLTTAEGGMITGHDPELARRLRRLRFHGIERLAFERYGKGGRPHYDLSEPGFKYNFPERPGRARAGAAQAPGRKQRQAPAPGRGLPRRAGRSPRSGLAPAGKPAEAHGWHLFIIKVKAMERDEFMVRLQDYNIGTGLHFPACHLLRYVRERYGYRAGDFPECERAAARIISLPLFPDLTRDNVRYVAAAIREIVEA